MNLNLPFIASVDKLLEKLVVSAKKLILMMFNLLIISVDL